MILTALHCESSFLYRQDKGTARCRLKLEDLNLFGIKLGNIIKIKLFFHESIDSTFFEVLCIAWLNDADYSDAGIIILDDTVRVSYPQLLPTWSQLHCKVSDIS